MTNFQFSIFNQFPISKFSKKPAFRLVVVTVVCIVLGAVIGLVLNYQTLKELREDPSVPSAPVNQVGEKEEKEKIATFSGKVKPSLQPEKAPHYLEDDSGKMIVFLTGGKVESGFLEMLEGQLVEVVGRLEEDILVVDEVRL